MKNYSIIIRGELWLQKAGYVTTLNRYGIDSSTDTLIMKQFYEFDILINKLRTMGSRFMSEYRNIYR